MDLQDENAQIQIAKDISKSNSALVLKANPYHVIALTVVTADHMILSGLLLRLNMQNLLQCAYKKLGTVTYFFLDTH